MKLKKLKLNPFDLRSLQESEMRKVLGGFVAITSGVSTVSMGNSASVSLTNGSDVDKHDDVDAENDTSVREKEEFLKWG